MGDLSSATVGTKIKVPRTFRSGFYLGIVTRVTNSQVCCGNTRLRKEDGLVVGSGDSWNRKHASIATDSDILQYRIDCATFKLRDIEVTAENVDVIEALLRGEV